MSVAKMVLEYVFIIHLHESVQNALQCYYMYKVGCNSISISPTQNIFILLQAKQQLL